MDSAGFYNAEAVPITPLSEVVVKKEPKTTILENICQAIGNVAKEGGRGISNVFGAMTGASSFSPELNAAYNADHAPATDSKSVGITYAIIGGPIAAVGATTCGYGSYCSWFAGTSTSTYFTVGAGGSITTSAFMTDANYYFGASLLQASGRAALFNGLASITGQLVYNGGLNNFNVAQPIFAAAFGNPFASNYLSSSFNVIIINGNVIEHTNHFNSNFFSTFGSNLLGNKIGSQFVVKLGYIDATCISFHNKRSC